MTTVLSALSEQNFGNNTRQVEAALKKHEAIAADIEARVYSLINCVTIQLTDLVSFTVDDQEVVGLTTSQLTVTPNVGKLFTLMFTCASDIK